jgi:tRNA threonylcarbamoyladenosine biosynthesis protein TsaB
VILLTIRTDKPEAEVGLYEDAKQVACITWMAHRQLAETLHAKVRELLHGQGKQFHDIEAIGCYAGPGSFTGLRIGLSVGNAFAYGLEVPIVAETGQKDWQVKTISRLLAGQSDPLALPEYGADVHITLPKIAPKSLPKIALKTSDLPKD